VVENFTTKKTDPMEEERRRTCPKVKWLTAMGDSLGGKKVTIVDQINGLFENRLKERGRTIQENAGSTYERGGTYLKSRLSNLGGKNRRQSSQRTSHVNGKKKKKKKIRGSLWGGRQIFYLSPKQKKRGGEKDCKNPEKHDGVMGEDFVRLKR